MEPSTAIDTEPWPTGRKSPEPISRYNLVAIGGGTAGIAAALEAVKLGGKAAIVEREQLGGRRIFSGQIPRRALLQAALRSHQARCTIATPFAEIMAKVRASRAAAIQRMMDALNPQIDLFFGNAQFVGPDQLQVGDQTLRFRRAVIAIGSRMAPPELPGLETQGYLTEAAVYELDALPRRLIVLGAGAAGCEFAQAFRRLGAEVHLVDARETLLPGELPEAAAIVQRQFEREGITLRLGWTPTQVDRAGAAKVVIVARNGDRLKLIADEILVAGERKPNAVDLGLDKAGVKCGDQGVQVDDWLRTSNPAIFAAGSVCGSDHADYPEVFARLAACNAMLLRYRRTTGLMLPHCTLTDPEIARVWLSPSAAAEEPWEIDVHRAELSEIDDCLTTGAAPGFIEMETAFGTDRILGALAVGPNAGGLLAPVVLAMTNGLGLKAIAKTHFCDPAQAAAFQRLTSKFVRERRSPRIEGWLQKWHSWRRS